MSTLKDPILVDFSSSEICNCLFRNKSSYNKCIILDNEDIFTPVGIISLMNNFYWADVIRSSCRMDRDVPSGKKS